MREIRHLIMSCELDIKFSIFNIFIVENGSKGLQGVEKKNCPRCGNRRSGSHSNGLKWLPVQLEINLKSFSLRSLHNITSPRLSDLL